MTERQTAVGYWCREHLVPVTWKGKGCGHCAKALQEWRTRRKRRGVPQ